MLKNAWVGEFLKNRGDAGILAFGRHGATNNQERGSDQSPHRASKFRFQNLEISSLRIRAIRLIRGSQSSHFLKRT